MLMPVLTARFLARLNFRGTMLLLALVCVLPALAAVFTDRSAFPSTTAPADALAGVLNHPLLWFAGLAFFLYAPLEGSLGTWARRYLTDVGYGERMALWLVTGFWLFFLAGRLAAAFLERGYYLSRTTGQGVFIVVLAMAAAVLLGNLAGARKGLSAALGLLALGAVLGPIFPTLVGILFDFEAFKQVRGTAYGVMFAFGALGNLLVPPFIGAYVRRSTVQRSMKIDMLMGLAMALTSLIMVLTQS
jgi:hypothetical protein